MAKVEYKTLSRMSKVAKEMLLLSSPFSTQAYGVVDKTRNKTIYYGGSNQTHHPGVDLGLNPAKGKILNQR